MNFEDWRKLGNLTKIIRSEIMEMRHGYVKSSKEARWLASAEKGIDKVRDKLDNLVFEQCSEENTNDLTKVFYGSIEGKAIKCYIGKVVNMKLKDQEYIALEALHDPDDATLSLRLGPDFFLPYLGKTIKITIQEMCNLAEDATK